MKKLLKILAICVPVLTYAQSQDARQDYINDFGPRNIMSTSSNMCIPEDQAPLVYLTEYQSNMCCFEEPQRKEEEVPLIFKNEDSNESSGGHYE